MASVKPMYEHVCVFVFRVFSQSEQAQDVRGAALRSEILAQLNNISNADLDAICMPPERTYDARTGLLVRTRDST